MKSRQKKRVKIFDEKGLAAFAKQLKKIRKAKDISQEELSDKSGIALSQIAKIETTKGNPTMSTIFTLIRALDVTPPEMFDFKLPK